MTMKLPVGNLSCLLVAVCLGMLGLWIYWPGAVSAPILDDLGNLDKLGRLTENPEYAWDYISGNRSGSLGRPVAMATFVLETLYFGHIPDITLKLNVLIHLGNGLLATLLLWLLFLQAGFRRAGMLAVLLGALWLLAPIQVSTVLYQVQRMAMLCAGFMLLSCICYILWRWTASRHAWLWLAACVVSAVLALLSKENAVVIVPVLLLLEVLWLSNPGSLATSRPGLRSVSLILIVTGFVVVLAGVVLNWSTLQAMHGFREFSLEQRLLTQARVLWDYVAQFSWPDPSRLGLYHDDVVISRALWQPASTAWAITAWLVLLSACSYLCRYEWGRYLSLGPLLFLVGHGIEGTVFPLELYFEHRNYFPSIGLVILLGAMIGLLGRSWPQVVAPLLAWLGLAVLVLAMITSSQVQIWSSPLLRTLHHVNGHPESFRANADMAVLLAETGDIQAAAPYARAASDVGRNMSGGDLAVFALMLDCLAGASFDQANIDRIGFAEGELRLGSSNILLSLVRALERNTCPGSGADRFSDRMFEVFVTGGADGSDRLFFALAVMENSLAQYGRANAYADRFLARTSRKSTALLMKLHFLTALGDRAEVDRVVAELKRMDRAGKLTLQEQDNLGYYLGTPKHDSR